MWTKLPSRLIHGLQMRFGEVVRSAGKPVETKKDKMIIILVI